MLSYIQTHHETIFIYGLYLSYLLYAVILLGISASAPKYLEYLRGFLKLYVSLFLIWRFNPLRKEKMTNFDRRIVFSSALFLLTTTILTQIAMKFIKPIETHVRGLVGAYA